MQVYVNYPYPHITIHTNDKCHQVRVHQKEEQRCFVVRPGNVEAVVGELVSERFVFRSDRDFNDLWLDISLDTSEQDLEFVHRVLTLMGERYERLSRAPISIHCG